MIPPVRSTVGGDRICGEAATVRQAEPSDLDTLVALDEQIFAPGWSRESWHEMSLQATCRSWLLVAAASQGSATSAKRSLSSHNAGLDRGHAFGFATTLTSVAEAEVLKFGICREARRRGLATLLLRHLSRDLRSSGVNVTSLEVRAGNRAARNLYAKEGFEAMGLRRAYYSNGDDAVVLRRTLAPHGRNP